MARHTTEPSHLVRPVRRWRILRDLAMLQLKLLVGNLHNFLLMPVCLFAGAIDILFKNRRHEALLYKALAWGRHFEERIGLYNALRDDDANPPEKYNIDAVIEQLESIIRHEYESGEKLAAIRIAVSKARARLHLPPPRAQ